MAHLPDIFGVKLAQQINNALGPLLLPVTLTKVTIAPDPLDSTRVLTTTVVHNGRGFTETKKVYNRNNNLVEGTVRMVSILGASLPGHIIPAPGDRVEIEGEPGKIAENGVERDPAGALYVCQIF